MGDSLVQKVGGISVDLRDLTISEKIKRKLKYLREEERRFYNNDPSRKFGDYEAIQKEEIKIFQNILLEEIINLDIEVHKLAIQIHQPILFRDNEEVIEKKEKEWENIKFKIKLLKEKQENLEKIKDELKSKGKQFVIWEIDFVDVFEEKGGFDIVIGNPPYIRTGGISPPFKPKNETSKNEIQKYKDDLIENIKIKYPFIKKFNRNCDYYIYFYFQGLSLLNPKGTFCFITSNSWLDVGYGKSLQEFLVKNVPINAIYYNQVKRAFEHASINTVIVFFGAPLIKNSKNQNSTCLDNLAKFIIFKKPYEEVISSQNLILIDKFNPEPESLFGNTLKTDQFRVYAIKQGDLLEEGTEIKQSKNEVFDSKLFGEYVGSKWGGNYLRAPDIYFTILKKAEDKLVRLGDIAEVRRGFTTGVNEFFYVEDVTDKIQITKIKPKIKNMVDFSNVKEIKEAGLRIIYNKKDDSYWLIEEDLLKPLIKSPRECKSVIVKMADLKYKIFMCNKSKRELKRTKAIEYIMWGEKQKYHKRPTCASRKYWWDLGKIDYKIVYPCTHNPSWVVFYNPKICIMDKVFYGIKFCNSNILCTFLNSTFTLLQAENLGYSLMGGGGSFITVEDLEKLLILDLKIIEGIGLSFEIDLHRKYKSIYQEFGFDPTKPIREQQPNPLPDRKALDDVVFDALGLTQEERKEVYWATAELVKNRLDKARSVKKK